MRADFSNVLALAATLSMAGWVARTPDQPQTNYLADFNQQNDGYNRFHPYQQQHQNQFGHPQPQQNGPLVDQAVISQFNQNVQNNLHQSKDAEETFRAYMELQELISWQDSYRRGDMQIPQNNNHQYVMPVTSNNLDNIFTNVNDDGYSSGSSVGSPGSNFAGDVDNLSDFSGSNNGSPLSSTTNQFNQFDSNFQAPPFQQINENPVEGTFDIDELLNGDGAMSPEMPYNTENQKVPFSNLLTSLDQNLNYGVNLPSALKNPSVDSFLGKPSPEYKPFNTISMKNDDPFNVKFTNASFPDDFASDTLVDIGRFDPSIFDDSNSETQDDMLDKALVESLVYKGNPAAVAIKQEDDDEYWLNPGSPMVEHDYFNRDESSPRFTAANPVNKHQPRINFNQPSPYNRPQTITPRAASASSANRVGGRTFAPSHTVTSSSTTATSIFSRKSSSSHTVKPKVKKQKTKSNVLWSDFPYTPFDLVDMPVEKFNEIIKQLDEVRQHVAKDERRKGKNKLAARNCRKRKMEVIDNLDTGVSKLGNQQEDLLNERQRLLEETRQIKRKTEWLNNYILEQLRDSNGLPYNTQDYSLKYTSDGDVYVVPTVAAGSGNNNAN